jgi:3-methyladenine DNA glycosylase AlkD
MKNPAIIKQLQKPKAADLLSELKSVSDPERAMASLRYFKTGKGQYGEGDVFLGVTVPNQRKLAKKFSSLPLAEIKTLLCNKVHECRLTALFILVDQYRKADDKAKEKIVQFYLKNKSYVNNWDLVDSSASYILGNYLIDRPKELLYQLANSKSVWDRRIAIMSTQAFIAANKFSDTLKLSKILLHDPHDLIHKAVGWMLREVGNRSMDTEKQFLEKHATVMPRTMLRYAIEKFPVTERKRFLAMK